MALLTLFLIASLSTALCLWAFYQVMRLKIERALWQIKCLFYRLP